MTEIETLKARVADLEKQLALQKAAFDAACILIDREHGEVVKLRRALGKEAPAENVTGAIAKSLRGAQRDGIARSGAGTWTPGIPK